jgi:hypothetical protein
MKKTKFKPTLIELIDLIVSSIKLAPNTITKYSLEKGLQDMLDQEFNDDLMTLSIDSTKSTRVTIFGYLKMFSKMSSQQYSIEVYPRFSGAIEINTDIKDLDLINQVKRLLLKKV